MRVLATRPLLDVIRLNKPQSSYGLFLLLMLLFKYGKGNQTEMKGEFNYDYLLRSRWNSG